MWTATEEATHVFRTLSLHEAYVLCSLVGDLKILEIVDSGVWNVGFTIPLSIF